MCGGCADIWQGLGLADNTEKGGGVEFLPKEVRFPQLYLHFAEKERRDDFAKVKVSLTTGGRNNMGKMQSFSVDWNENMYENQGRSTVYDFLKKHMPFQLRTNTVGGLFMRLSMADTHAPTQTCTQGE